MNFESNRLYRILPRHHVIFWLVYFVITVIRWGGIHGDYLYSLKTTLLGFPIHMFLAYLNIYVLMPKLAFKKKYFTYIVATLSTIFLMVVLKFNLTYYLISTNVWPEVREIDRITINYIIDMMIGEIYVITFVTAIKITMDFLQENQRVANLEKAQLETELLFLKTQISPHFFFNTLNNIYSLAVVQSKKTPKIILKLSELMRYLLYETKGKKQSLQNEILCIQNYLDLERVRHNDELEIEMSISGDIQGKKIAPILLLSFVENAFKHGVRKNIGEVKITIDFEIKKDWLYFTITNPLPKQPENKENISDQYGGIGLENVKKRLELGYQPSDYKLIMRNKNGMFVVKLKIKVS